MKISYNYGLTLSSLLFFIHSSQTVSAAENTFSKHVWNMHDGNFKDYDSTEGSNDDPIVQTQITPLKTKSTSRIINSNARKCDQSENSSEDDYEETVLANLKKHESKVEEKKQGEFYQYLNKHLQNKISIEDLSYENKIETIDHIIQKYIENNSLVLKRSIDDCKSNVSLRSTIIDPEKSSKDFGENLNNLNKTLDMHSPKLVNVGLGYYSHKFFRLYYDSCKPEKDDTLEFWLVKCKIFKTNILCFINQFNSNNLSRHSNAIKKKSESILVLFFKDSCEHLVHLYKNRNGLTMSLSQNGLRESQTKISFSDFTKNYLLDFNFLKSNPLIEDKIIKIKDKNTGEIDKIDEAIAKAGLMKTVLGDSSAIVVNVGTAILNTAVGQGGTLLTNAGSYFSNYYNGTSTVPQQQTNTNTTTNTNTEPKKGWFW